MSHVDKDRVIHLADRSRAGLMERCRQRALGMMEQDGPYEVWQHQGADRGYRQVGFMPSIPARSTSGMFQLRPGDFSWGEIDGKRVILAIWSICPGDWSCVPGFVQSDGTPPERSPFVEQFDQLEKFGADRMTSIETIIADALRRK